jgi:hypothetical protein
MPIDGHTRREPPPLPFRAYLSTPRASLRLPSLTSSSPTSLADSRAPNRARRRRPLKLGRRHRSPPPPSPPPLSRRPKLHRVVKKLILASLLFLLSRTPRRRLPAAGRPPPLAPRLGRRPNRPFKRTFEFANTPATLRCIPRAF